MPFAPLVVPLSDGKRIQGNLFHHYSLPLMRQLPSSCGVRLGMMYRRSRRFPEALIAAGIEIKGQEATHPYGAADSFASAQAKSDRTRSVASDYYVDCSAWCHRTTLNNILSPELGPICVFEAHNSCWRIS